MKNLYKQTNKQITMTISLTLFLLGILGFNLSQKLLLLDNTNLYLIVIDFPALYRITILPPIEEEPIIVNPLDPDNIFGQNKT